MNDEPSQARIAALLSDALNGDTSQIDELRRVSQHQLHAAGQALGGHLTFGRPTVLRVLRDWRDARATEDQVRCWALLMFHGAFPDDCRPLGWRSEGRAELIDFDYSDDETVNEVVFELKDLGDPYDFGLSIQDREKLIAELSQ